MDKYCKAPDYSKNFEDELWNETTNCYSLSNTAAYKKLKARIVNDPHWDYDKTCEKCGGIGHAFKSNCPTKNNIQELLHDNNFNECGDYIRKQLETK